MQVYRDRFAVRDVEFMAKVEEGLPRVMADPEKMTRVIERVLDNSLKFTPPEGYVHISALKSSESIITITIENSGPGIPSSDTERVFERFEQSGDIMTAKPEGTGLGLPIARNIVHKHGGQIRIDENFTEGCRTILTLPVADNGQGAATGGKM
jgi:signal transduction histidine kinase